MASMGMDDSWDPEAGAEDAANKAFLKLALKKLAGAAGLLAGSVLLLLGDWVFALLVASFAPRLVSCLVAAVVSAEVSVLAASAGYGLKARKAKKAEREPLSEGQQVEVSLDILKSAEFPRPWWRTSPRKLRFWRTLAARAFYSGCLALDFYVWTGSWWAAAGAGAGWTAAAFLLGDRLVSAVTGFVAAAVFIDPRQRPDTPEI